MQTRLGPQHLLCRRHPADPTSRQPLPAPQPTQIQHAPAQGQQLVLGDRARLARIIPRAPRDPQVLALDGKDARAAELDPVRARARVRLAVERQQSGALRGPAQREGDEDRCGAGERAVGLGGVGGGVEGEFYGAVAPGCRSRGVGDALMVQEGEEEGRGPASAQDEHGDSLGLCLFGLVF